MLLPAFTGSGASVLLMVITGALLTVVVIEAPLTGAVWALSMLYVPLVITVPFARGLATWKTGRAPCRDTAYTSAMVEVTTTAASVPQPDDETNEVLAGMVSVITTPVAFMFPVFE